MSACLSQPTPIHSHRSGFRSKFGTLCGGTVFGRSNTHHRPADNVARSQQIEVFVDLTNTAGLVSVPDLTVGGEGHDLADVRIVAPERPMKGLLTRHPRE